MSRYWIYILCSQPKGTLYIGVTNNLIRRIYEHKNNIAEGFTKKYSVDRLVYTEEFSDIREAIERETCLKRWKRAWKIRLIEEQNPQWIDLYETVLG